jgi:YidC/Oxa1 family membrane protein insertase
MDQKVIIAIALAMLVLVGWNAWYYYRYKDLLEKNRIAGLEKQATGKPGVKTRELPRSKAGQIEEQPGVSQEFTPLSPFAPAPEEIAETTSEDLIIIDTGVSVVTLSKVGAVIDSWKLMKYSQENGEPIELANQEAKYRPLAIGFATPEATAKINSARFTSSSPARITLYDSKPVKTVTFSFNLESGFELVKKMTFHHNSYRLDLELVVNQPGGGVTSSTYDIAWPGMGDGMTSFYSYRGPVIMIDGKRLTEQPDEGEKQSYEGGVQWAGVTSKYYCVAFLPEAEHSKITNTLVGEEKYSTTLQMVTAGSRSVNRVAIYAGPKIRDELGKMGRDFKNMINYGWFDVIAKPLFVMMNWFNSITGNWGWSIIIVTVIIKVLFFPLSQKSFKSMKSMQKLQPKMKLLQERYKNDKTKLNEELMALYKAHKVNPLGGCLPMILQIPVFIALYRVLLESIELKGAPFIFWLVDLSAKDPYYITPVLMGLSMFAQQKLSPASGDPIQRNMMLIMPVVFTVMFLNFPSGLVIYWLVNNILSIMQQYYINRSHRYEVA